MKTDLNIPAVPIHPGELLAEEFLGPMEMTQTAFAAHLGVPVRRINEVCRGRRAVTAETACLFAQALGTSPQFWLNAQSLYELALAKREGRIRKVKRLKV
jgi:addiction module HigA family antidote